MLDLKPDERVLDVGCGIGETTSLILPGRHYMLQACCIGLCLLWASCLWTLLDAVTHIS